MDVESAAGGAADLLMECDEEEQEVCSLSPETDEEEENEGVELKRDVCRSRNVLGNTEFSFLNKKKGL